MNSRIYVRFCLSCCVMIVILGACLLSSALAQEVSLIPSSQLDKCNDVDTLWISCDANIKDMEAADFKIGYDSVYVSPSSVIKGPDIGSGDFLAFRIYHDSILINLAVLVGHFDGPGKVAGIILSPYKEVASTSISFGRSVLRDTLNGPISHTTFDAAVEVDCTPPDVPVLSTPGDNSFTNDNTPTFTWSSTAGSGGSYTLEYSTSSDFSSGVVTVPVAGESYTPVATLADGVWYWHVKAKDKAGNESLYQGTAFSFTVDTQAPVIPTLLTPSDNSFTNDNTPTFTWSSTAGSGGSYTLEYSTSSDFSSGVVTVPVAGESYTPVATLADGVWYWHVKAKDKAGNESLYQGTAFSFTVDTQAPVIPTLLTPSDNSFTNDNTPTFTWSSTAGSGGSYTLEYSTSSDFSSGVVTVPVAGESYTPVATLADGVWYWHVKAKDKAGNESLYQGTAFSFTVDTQAPVIPTLLTPSDNSFTNDNTPTFTWSSTAGSGGSYTLEYSTSSDFSSGVVTVPVAGESYTPVATLADGVWYWHVKAKDKAGNESLYQGTAFSFTVDTQAPVIPTLLTPSDNSFTNDNTPTFTWSSTAGSGGSYTLEYSTSSDFSSGVVTVPVAGESYTPVATLADGVWYWHVKAKDKAGNESLYQGTAFSFTVDTQAPVIPTLLTPSDNSFTNDNTPTFTWSSTAGSGGSYTLEYSTSSDFSSGVVTVPVAGESYTPVATLADGVWYWHVKAKDKAGNESLYQGTAFSFTVDTQAPVIPTLLTPSDNSFTNDNTPTFTWSSTAGSGGSYTLEYSTSSDFSSGVVTVPVAGESYTPVATLADGVWYWHVKAKDKAGNESLYQGTAFSFTVDIQAPSMATNFMVQPGHEKCKLSWTNPTGDPSFAGVEIRRNPWCVGAYPEYDDICSPLGYPATHTDGDLVYQGSGTSFKDSSGVLTLPRNVYYYTIFSYDKAGNYSVATTAQQGRATNYWLGDVSGNGEVYYEDLTYFSNTYWTSRGDLHYDSTFDIGPTYNMSPKGIPTTDNVINFEDLAIFAINFAKVGPSQKTVPVLAGQDIRGPLGLSLVMPEGGLQAGREFKLQVVLNNNPGTVKAIHFVLPYDPAQLEFTGVDQSAELKGASYPVFFDGRTRDNQVDVSLALLGGNTAIGGSGQIASISFRLLQSKDLSLGFSQIDLRDGENNKLSGQQLGTAYASVLQVPKTYGLSQNYPNPYNLQTRIAYQLPQPGMVSLNIYNICGQLVRTLVNEYKAAGNYTVTWDGKNGDGVAVSSGIYFYRLSSGSFSATRKMVMLK